MTLVGAGLCLAVAVTTATAAASAAPETGRAMLVRSDPTMGPWRGSARVTPAASFVHRVGVVDRDERLTGDFGSLRASHPHARRHLARALHVTFPLPGSQVGTGTPICYRDTVLTAAHLTLARGGDVPASPLGMRISLPSLDAPGRFDDVRTVSDFRSADGGRTVHIIRPIPVGEDFILLRLNEPLPDSIEPLGLPASLDTPPVCSRPTVNAAYHGDIGLRGGRPFRMASLPGMNVRGTVGRVPLLTEAVPRTVLPRQVASLGAWADDEFFVAIDHDTAHSASGSAVVCPGGGPRARDTLMAVVVGETRLPGRGDGGVLNVAGANLRGIAGSLARLRGVSLERLLADCGG
jgi:hypothetical protein